MPQGTGESARATVEAKRRLANPTSMQKLFLINQRVIKRREMERVLAGLLLLIGIVCWIFSIVPWIPKAAGQMSGRALLLFWIIMVLQILLWIFIFWAMVVGFVQGRRQSLLLKHVLLTDDTISIGDHTIPFSAIRAVTIQKKYLRISFSRARRDHWYRYQRHENFLGIPLRLLPTGAAGEIATEINARIGNMTENRSSDDSSVPC